MTSFEQLAAVAERSFPGARLLETRRLEGGVSADVHALELELPKGQRHAVVVRCHGEQKWKAREQDVAALEYRLLEVLYRAGLPVPEPLLLDATGEILRWPYLVMGFVTGSTDVPPDRLDTCIEVLADTLTRLHGLPPATLPALPLRVDPLPELLDYLPPASASAVLRTYLSRAEDSAYVGPRTLLHGDYWPGNLMWHNGELVAVLDWEDAALGDPACDVAGCRLELLWRYGPAAVARFTAGYARRRAIDARRLAYWEVFVAAAGARFMHEWGLPAEQEARMRAQAEGVVRAATRTLLTP